MKSKNIKEKVEEFFRNLGIEGEVEIDEKNEQRMNFKTKEGNLLIGRGGRTLRSLERILRLVLKEEGKELILDINDYQKERVEQLEKMAKELAEKARKTQKPQVLPFMPAADRRIIHLALKDEKDLVTESEGEEPRRRIVIRLKK